jgi:hypothetical protein
LLDGVAGLVVSAPVTVFFPPAAFGEVPEPELHAATASEPTKSTRSDRARRRLRGLCIGASRVWVEGTGMIPFRALTLVSLRNAVNDFGDVLSLNDKHDSPRVIMSHQMAVV